ncbi:MAG TPA: hypothetical protein VNW46_00365 [Gemmatimonadaceae bacterium]|nr:hypothetical protein [Gemmatimonadaceae bacterium]
MPAFFPRQTIAWHLERAAGFRGLTLSVIESGLLTGVVLRLFRAMVIARPSSAGWWVLAYVTAFGVMLTGAAALHLGNYTVRHWIWRAPAFGALAAVGEMLTSLPLIAVHREPWGNTGRADFNDWPLMARETLFVDVALVCAFAIILAAVVQSVRYLLVRHEHRGHTLQAIHAERAHGEGNVERDGPGGE